MSLLLDALKKAAEQNAENSRETGAEHQSSDETLLRDQTTTKIAPESEAPDQHAPSDISEFDLSEISLDNVPGDEHTVEADEPIAGSFNEDESLVFTDDDVSTFMGDDTLLGHEHEDVTKQPHNETKFETSNTQLNELDEDLSISLLAETEGPIDDEPSESLFDRDDTLATSEAAKQTGALSEPFEQELALQIDPTKSLNLVDVPDKDGTEVNIGRTEIPADDTSVSGPGLNTLIGDGTSTRTESASTQTFAPDNYDRTLRKPGSDDASKLFAGLKPDTDIVMTPEYAKTMFHSKTSAKRVQNFKIYSGTALGILMVIAALGVLEIDEETINIDNSLRHLKRDPMPGLIKNPKDETFTDIFAAAPGSEVDATTLQLVENAELMVDTEEVVAVELGVNDEVVVDNTNTNETGAEMKSGVQDHHTQEAKVETNPVNDTNDNNGSLLSLSRNKPAASPAIQISSKSKISEKDRWLHEAYEAYRRGDDQLALVKYNAVLDVDPNNRNALLARAAINIQNNRIAEAIRDYRKLLLANPKDSLAMSSMIAVANYSPAQSETQLKLMIRDEPGSPYLNFALGNIFGTQNRWQEAQGMYFAALENNPDDPNYAYNLAVSLEHIAKPKVAIVYYERALSNFTKGLATFNREVVNVRLEMLRQL